MNLDGFISTLTARNNFDLRNDFFKIAKVKFYLQPMGLFCHFRTFLADEMWNYQFENLLENKQDHEHIRGRQSLKASQ